MKYYSRIIINEYSKNAETTAKEFVLGVLNALSASEIKFTEFEPYYKFEGTGELNLYFTCDKAKEEIQSCFAETWKHGCADERWSRIYCDKIMFIWLPEAE